MTGARRSWLKGGRPEPFAACLSLRGPRQRVTDLAVLAHEMFQDSRRRSLTSGLTRTLLAVHSTLSEENGDLPEDERSLASGIAAALRPTGLYVAQMGEGLIGNVRLGTLWARSWEADGPPDEGVDEEEDGTLDAAPPVTTEFFHLAPGDAYLFLPGLNGSEVAEEWLAGALSFTPDLDAVGELLRGAPQATAGLVVWWPGEERAAAVDSRWVLWPGKSSSPDLPRIEPTPAQAPAAGFAITRGRALALGGAMLLAVLATWAILRSLTPDPTVPEAAALIGQAESTADRNAAAASLDQAIARLQPRAGRDEQALALLNRAQARRDQVLEVVRVGEIERFALPPSGQTRPVGLWRSEESLFVLDLGVQILYRSDLHGARVENLLRPGDSHADQPMGRLVSGAFSPPRGINTDGRLLLVDTARSILSIGPSGFRRWWPPDGDQWERIGPAAATFDDLFLLDTGRNVIWQYSSRIALARGSLAATTRDEPRLAQTLDLASDGNLYLLLPDGAIRKLAPGGGGLPFDGRVPGDPLRGAVALFAHPDLDRLWVLEPAASRVVELTPAGDYARQYVFPPNVLRQGVGLHVDGETQELRVLTTEHVLSVKIG